MAYFLKGNLCGRICDNCEESLSNVQVKLYHLRDDQSETELATAETKNNFSILSEDQVEAKEKNFIASNKTEEDGSFKVPIKDNQITLEESIEIDVYIERAPGQEERPDDVEPVQFTVDVIRPNWKETEEGMVADWGDHCISQRYWCKIREKLGAYVICGQVFYCNDEEDQTKLTRRPLANYKVTAFDRDWIQDDPLGSAQTDSNGRFRIYYSPQAFKKGTVLDVELIGGPDLYFNVETSLGSPVLQEDPSKGRDAGRENVGPCFCTELCVKEEPQDPPEPEPLFSHIGGLEYETDIDSQFPGTGFTVGSGRAFFGNLRLNGTLSKTQDGNPIEYRFEIREYDASGSAIGNWQPIMRDQIAHTKIGVLQKNNPNYPATSSNPIRNVDYIIGSPDADERAANVVNDGTYDWIQVPQESSSPFSSTGYFKPNDNLIQLNTRKLNPAFDDIDLSGLETGKSSTDTGKALAENRHFKIRMRVRDVGTSGPGDIQGICEHIAINNTLYDNINSHPSWYSNVRSNQLAVAMVNIEQLKGTGCTEIDSQLDVLFTAAHPNLGSVNINMTGPGGPYGFSLPSTGTSEDRYGTASPNFTVSNLKPCAYIVNLSVEVLLTTGDATPDNLHDEIAFCKS